MAADAWSIYDSFREFLGDGTCDMDDDDFFMCLFLNNSNCNNDEDSDEYGDLTNEVADANGYSQGGFNISANIAAANQWLRSNNTVKFDTDDAVWTANNGNISGVRYAVIFDTTPAATPTDPLVCWTTLDNSNGGTDIPDITDTNNLTVSISANGVFTLSGG